MGAPFYSPVDVIGFIAALIGFIAALVVVIELKGHAVVRFLSLTALVFCFFGLVWTAGHGLFRANRSETIDQARLNAIEEEARAETRKKLEEQTLAEEQRAAQAASEQALRELKFKNAQKEILGSWRDATNKITISFNADGSGEFKTDSVPLLMPWMNSTHFTYHLVDTTHVVANYAFYWLTYDLHLDDKDPHISYTRNGNVTQTFVRQ